MIDYDSELQRHHQVLRRALDVRPRDRVLDIGCGTGQTTRDAALLSRDGSVLGIDLAESVLRVARQQTRTDGPRNLEFVRADAARLPVQAASVDVVISRFGTMFFADPVSAFAGLRQVLRPDGRLVMMVWQGARENAWAVAIQRALVGDGSAWPEHMPGPSAFSLGDSNTTTSILRVAGFTHIAFAEVCEPVYYGPDTDSAVGFVTRFSNVASMLESKPAVERERVVERLRHTMAAHCTRDGVWFNSRAWIVSARCA